MQNNFKLQQLPFSQKLNQTTSHSLENYLLLQKYTTTFQYSKPFSWGDDSAWPWDEMDIGAECRFLGEGALSVIDAAKAVRLLFATGEWNVSIRFFICLRSTSRGGLATELTYAIFVWRTGAVFSACERDMLTVKLWNFASRSSYSRCHNTHQLM